MEYLINKEKKTIHAKFMGPVNSDSLIHHILKIRSDRYFLDGFNIIVDFREAHVPRGYMELAQVAEFVKVTSVVRETFKLAILVKEPEQIRSANLYKLLVGHEHLQICETSKTAEEWVSPNSEIYNKP